MGAGRLYGGSCGAGGVGIWSATKLFSSCCAGAAVACMAEDAGCGRGGTCAGCGVRSLPSRYEKDSVVCPAAVTCMQGLSTVIYFWGRVPAQLHAEEGSQ